MAVSVGIPADRYRQLTLQSGHMNHPCKGSQRVATHPHPTINALTCSATTQPMPTVQTSERSVAQSAT